VQLRADPHHHHTLTIVGLDALRDRIAHKFTYSGTHKG
jgi:hypothetical protein